MNVSANGIKFIKGYERLRLQAYMPTTRDRPTIGYGHTGPMVILGMKITTAKAEELLANDIAEVEHAINDVNEARIRHSILGFNQHQFDALASLVFNVGVSAFRASRLAQKLVIGSDLSAMSEWRRWNKQGGQVVPGLSNRRGAEMVAYSIMPVETGKDGKV